MGIFDPLIQKIEELKEERKLKQDEDKAIRDARHKERIASAPERAKALEKAKLEQEIKEIKKGKKPEESGWTKALHNFSDNFSGSSGLGIDTDFMMGNSHQTKMTKKTVKNKQKKRKGR